jgi:DNA topoisomerase-1
MARIVYCDDSQPGITRRKMRHGWGYFNADGNRITDRDEIDRLNAIGLPPAYRDAWFCPKPHGHIQAIGWDEKGRKQYRYHLDFRARQETAKYEGCATFGRLLPKLRAQVEADLRLRSLSRERAVAAVVRLLDLGHIRVGNEGYARTNKSFGATTLRCRHAQVTGAKLKLKFRAKSGKEKVMAVTDRSLARFVKTCHDLPGQHLFQWLDEEGIPHPVSSSDVNEYIRAAMNDDFTAKHFRTWGASVLAFEALVTADKDIGLKTMLEPVTEALGNTPAIARKSYVHPLLIDIVKSGDQASLRERPLPRATQYLTRAERGLIALLDSPAKERRELKLAA